MSSWIESNDIANTNLIHANTCWPFAFEVVVALEFGIAASHRVGNFQ